MGTSYSEIAFISRVSEKYHVECICHKEHTISFVPLLLHLQCETLQEIVTDFRNAGAIEVNSKGPFLSYVLG